MREGKIIRRRGKKDEKWVGNVIIYHIICEITMGNDQGISANTRHNSHTFELILNHL